MRQVRQALGPDALIISSRSVDGGIEVMATDPSALDDHGRLRRAEPALQEVASAVEEGAAYRPAAAPPQPQPQSWSQSRPQSPPQSPPQQAPSAPYARSAYEAVPPAGYGSARSAAYATPEPSAHAPVRPTAYQQDDDEEDGYTYTPSRPAAPPPPAPPAHPSRMAARYVDIADLPADEPPAIAPAPSLEMPEPYTASALTTGQRAGAAYGAMTDSAMTDSALSVVDEDTPAPDAEQSPVAAQEWRQALEALRGTLENRIDGLLWSKGLRAEPVAATLFRTLLEAGFSAALVRALMDRLPRQYSAAQALNWARDELVSHLPVLGSEDELLGDGGVFALVGPTGVGKTTTLAKLAARCVARVGRDQLAMLTTDNFRIGAHEQLQIYGRLLGVPTRSVRDVGELRATLGELGHRKIILIDTTGISQRDHHVAEQAAMLNNAGRPVQRLLVLNAASQGDTLDEVAQAYRNVGSQPLRGCIITKVDEAAHYAAALDTAIRHRLPIHYVSRGQRVPEHMELPVAAELVDGAFACLKRPALYAPSESDLAALWSASREAAGGELADPVRRRQLLAAAVAQPVGKRADDEEEMDAALAWMNTDPACVQARLGWREFGGARPLPTEALWSKPLEMARSEFSATCQRHLLAIHGKAPLRGDGLPSGQLHAALLMSDRGAALSAPAHQLVLQHGAVTTYAAAGAAQGNPADALAARVQWLGDALPHLPVVHVIDAGTSALWSALSEQGHAWVSRCTGALRVVQDETPTILQAVAKTLGYVPVGQAGDMPGLTLMKDDKPVVLRLWAAGSEVSLAARGSDGAPLRLVCAKLIDPAGKVVSVLYGLTNVSVVQADAAAVARWLVLNEQAKSAFRYMVHAWQPLAGAGTGDDALQRQALMAGQLGAACWQLAHAANAAVMRRLLQNLMGPERKLPARLVPPALLRFFAMVEMAG
ncbi:flagellar biosynthesis protein FlhF [Achromobacter aloeverae]|uniref:Flagellar biosynthesis protein FlhF n=2 Tax=Achromobacter aloeverae TaxID=1750518 RepID=A0A4Q1HR32_9BURK|nr:flagellar biosynthesis protein FlhF [Achromobacter aloeverae]